MQYKLVVVRPFAGHVVGSVIEDPKQVTAVLSGEHAGHVVRVAETALAPLTTVKGS